MRRVFFSLKPVLATLSAAFLALASGAPAASAQPIVNVAEATWQHGGFERSARSNTVTLARSEAPRIQTFVPDPDGREVRIVPPVCGRGANPVGGGGDSTASIVAIRETEVLRIGQDLVFAITYVAGNRDPAKTDTVRTAITTTTGDREELIASESGPDTGVFIGTIATERLLQAAVPDNCRLSVARGTLITVGLVRPGQDDFVISAVVTVLADPFGVVFDSETGDPVSCAVVTLIDAVTGQPARVFAEDGRTPWPSTVITGAPVIDAAGTVVQMRPGEYWFPLTYFGNYKLRIETPDPYTAWSVVKPAELTALRRPDGRQFIINEASYGGNFALPDQTPVQVDIPVDRPSVSVSITKDSSRRQAQPGDTVFYTLTVRNPDGDRVKRAVTVSDTPSPWLRPRLDSIRIDGAQPPAGSVVASDGRSMQFKLGDLAPGAERRVTYAMTMRGDAPPGQAENLAEATDSLGRAVRTSAAVLVERDTLAGTMTVIGRVTAGACMLGGNRPGVPGVRVMMEDGSFAITDRDGRYHFDGLVPGTHVVQASPRTLPEGGTFIDCNRSTRSAGSSTSQFVIGQGGSLVVADFHAEIPADALARMEATAIDSDSDASAATITSDAADQPDTDWLARGDGPDDWLSPAIGENPRASVVRVAIRHRKGHTVRLFADGQPVAPLAFDGTTNSDLGFFAVSLWRNIPLLNERTLLRAEIVGHDGETVTQLDRPVYFTNAAARVALVPDQSRLVADGRTRPVVAIRVYDRSGRPLREGVSGEFTVNQPYQSADQLARQQADQLTRRGFSSARWTVADATGLALIELAPTMTSGALRMAFRFDERGRSREQQLETWMAPGNFDWTVVGLAEAAIGTGSAAGAGSGAAGGASVGRAGDLGNDARIAFYARGPVADGLSLTVAYDSAKQAGDQPVMGAINPRAYYTVYADNSLRQFDAASRGRFYARAEGRNFTAAYGDFETGFTTTTLGRYHRVASGLSGEARFGAVGIQAFGARIGSRFQRDEIQGQGISGPYRLTSRAIIPNTEQVVIETRDRFRSELIVERRELSRFIDYDIDVLAGTITFKQPVLSRDAQFNPQFIVIAYETDSNAALNGPINAGLRTTWTNPSDTVRIGATMITDQGDGARTDLAAADLHARIGAHGEVRAEIAASRRASSTAYAWMVEARHQSGNLDAAAYVRSADADFGIGQQNGVELGRRKVGVDARLRLGQNINILASGWQDDSLTSAARRRAAELRIGYSAQSSDLSIGVIHFTDRQADGKRNQSTVLEAAGTQRLLDNRLEITAATAVPIGQTESVDLPVRHRVGARFAVTNAVAVLGTYEYAQGKQFSASTLRGGLELTPWRGGRISTTLGQQAISEHGNRSFAAFGLAQTLEVSPALSLSATVDSNWTLSNSPPATALINPEHPAASGGQLGQSGQLFEEFTAVTLGAAWRRDLWSATLRGEYRDGAFANRWGIIGGVIRQLGDGQVLGSGITWTKATSTNRAESEIMDVALAWAHRPAQSRLAFLSKIEYRSDRVMGAVLGETGPAGRTALGVTGDAASRRLVGSLSANWSPQGHGESTGLARRNEFGLFLGSRYNLDSYGDTEVSRTAVLAGLDARFGIGERVEVGGAATVRANLDGGTMSYAVGPQIGLVPADNMLLTLGYNFAGFRDADFTALRQSDSGIYAAVRLKFDADTLSVLGLGR